MLALHDVNMAYVDYRIIKTLIKPFNLRYYLYHYHWIIYAASMEKLQKFLFQKILQRNIERTVDLYVFPNYIP